MKKQTEATVERCQCSDSECACKGECTRVAKSTKAVKTADGKADSINVCWQCGRDKRIPLGYAWLITVDHIATAGGRAGTNQNAVGVIGPSGCGLDEEDIRFLLPAEFRMRDGDGELYYEGLFVGDPTSSFAFGPLDDYGTPNAGCTTIEYKNAAGEWRPL